MATINQWADSPFPLMHTPNYESDNVSRLYYCFVSSDWTELIKDHIQLTHDEITLAASWMALLHNGLIRGLNTIYLQAPHVQPEDYASFIEYSLQWVRTVNSHHDGEEQCLFPDIEKAIGPAGKGIMDKNREQHGKSRLVRVEDREVFTLSRLTINPFLKPTLAYSAAVSILRNA